MAQAIFAYLIVALAAGWLVWSRMLPAAARGAVRRMAGLKTPDCGAAGPAGACSACAAAECPLATLKRATAAQASSGTPRNAALRPL